MPKTRRTLADAPISTDPTDPPHDRLLDFKAVSERLGGFSRQGIWAAVNEGRFPKPFKLGRRIFCFEAESNEWLRTSRLSLRSRAS